jgi:hypothetical protein
MTQTVRSITLAENDGAEVACELGENIMANRALLQEVKDKIEFSAKQQSGMTSKLETQAGSLENVQATGDALGQAMKHQATVMRNVHSLALVAERKTTSILSTTTDILNLITSTLSTVQSVASQLMKTFELCTKFTTEMRAAMGELLQRFWSLQAALSRIERALPMQVRLPILQFTDVFGDTMALPYQLCQNWLTFKEHCGGRMITKNKFKSAGATS